MSSPLLSPPMIPLRKKSPRLILGLSRSGLSVELDAHFRQLDWEVIQADAELVSAIAHRYRSAAIVLNYDSGSESGLLTCAKIRMIHPQARIVLVGPESAKLSRYARLAGAAGYLPDRVTAPAIVRAVLGN